MAPNIRCNDYLIKEDFFPTLLDIAQVKCRETKQPIDGISFLPMLKGKQTDYNKRALYPNLWGNDGPGIGTTSSIRKSNWKLIYYYDTGKKELFNIQDDIDESMNSAEQNPGLVQHLSEELGEYLCSIEAQRQSFKATGTLCPWPDEVFEDVS